MIELHTKNQLEWLQKSSMRKAGVGGFVQGHSHDSILSNVEISLAYGSTEVLQHGMAELQVGL